MLCRFAYFGDRILDLREIAAEPFDRLRVRPVGDRGKPRRLDEAKHVRRDRDAHVVTSAQQLPTDGDAGLDIAPTSIACHHKLHRHKPNSRGHLAIQVGELAVSALPDTCRSSAGPLRGDRDSGP